MNDKDINLIEKYIDGELFDETLSLFEQRLKSDKSLAKAYNKRIEFAKLWTDADNYSKTKAQITSILHKSETNFFTLNRYLIYSIAATIIVLIGVYFFLVQDNSTISNQLVVATDSISKKENPIVFQYDEPLKLAAIDTVGNKTKLLYPVNNEIVNNSESITFKWKSDSNQTDTLFIANYTDGKIILKLRIRLNDSLYTIKYPQFKIGKYVWYISKKTDYARFSVIDK